ncbi:hypothetical protein ACB098_04G149800 [Castanea mollissima]
MYWKQTEEHEHTKSADLENLIRQPTRRRFNFAVHSPPFQLRSPQSTAEMAEKVNKKDFQLMKEAWKAVQKAKQELTAAQERADAFVGDVVNSPELPVSSENEVHAIKYLRERHDFQGDAKISRELPEKAKAAIKKKAESLKVKVED